MTGKMSPAEAPTGPRPAFRADLTFFADAFDTEDDELPHLPISTFSLTMRERTAFPETLLRRLPKLRMLGITGADVATLDLEACSHQGIVCVQHRGRWPRRSLCDR